MRATLLDTCQVTRETRHSAFTSIARWKGTYYLAYRSAQHHGITPPGEIHILTSDRPARAHTWTLTEHLAHPEKDFRDPRLVATPDYLFMICGAYVPSPHLQYVHGLSAMSGDNQIWSYFIYTRDGRTWSQPHPMLRPNAWAWSAAVTQGGMWCMASYDVGAMESCNTITLWGGTPMRGFQHRGVMYDGGNLEKDDSAYRYTASMPSEPVLYQPTPETLACCLRTGTTMLLGVVRHGLPWRWEETGLRLHPSAILRTQYGWLLAARELVPVYKRAVRGKPQEIERYDTSVTLWAVQGNRFAKVLTLEGSGDCGYCGMCEGEKPGDILVSYYASDKAPVPCADVFVAQVRVEG